MTIILTGGGSGGHIIPILAVADELKRQNPDNRIVYIGQKGDSLSDIPARDPNIDKVYGVYAGKFRRYHGEGIKQLLDFKTILLNIRDAFYVLIGIYQSWRLMAKIKPQIVFSRGGFVSVPVALGAKFHSVPYITHDSDAIPSLANKLIAKWAKVHAVALPIQLYPYPKEKTVMTGIPLNNKFNYISETAKTNLKQQLGLPNDAKVLFIIGGGLGSQSVNNAVALAIPKLLNEHQDLFVFQSSGRGNDAELNSQYDKILSPQDRKRVKVYSFIDDVYKYSGAADLVITRAGATNLAEFALQGKACIVLPSSFLAGGHQLKNAEHLKSSGAIEVITVEDLENNPSALEKLIAELLSDPKRCKELGDNFNKFAQPDAAKLIANLVMDNAKANV